MLLFVVVLAVIRAGMLFSIRHASLVLLKLIYFRMTAKLFLTININHSKTLLQNGIQIHVYTLYGSMGVQGLIPLQ